MFDPTNFPPKEDPEAPDPNNPDLGEGEDFDDIPAKEQENLPGADEEDS